VDLIADAGRHRDYYKVSENNLIAIYRNASVIYNPRAGKLIAGGNLLEQSLEALRAVGHCVTPVPTTGPLTAGAMAGRCVEAGADLILAAGGDGTINEVIQGMAGTSVPLGILPVGTANVLGNELRLGRSAQRVASQIHRMLVRRVALGRLRTDADRWFLLMAGIGLDAHIVYRLNLDLKARWGKGAYWLAGAGMVRRPLAAFGVEVDGATFASTFTLVSRVRNYGGDFQIAPTATLLDDTFEVVSFESKHSVGYLKYLAGMLGRRLQNMRGVSVLRARHLRLEASADPRVYIQVDGEFAGRLPAEIDIVPDALSLLMPEEYPAGE
jgi:diacylglycerol kinase (ATP)